MRPVTVQANTIVDRLSPLVAFLVKVCNHPRMVDALFIFRKLQCNGGRRRF